MKGSPVLRDSLNAIFTDMHSLWWHLAFGAAGPAFLMFSWSGASADFFLARGRGPGTLAVLTFVSAFLLYATAGGFTMGRLSRTVPHPFVHWLKYTPVGSLSYLNARMLYHLIHTLILALLVLPALMTAGAGTMSYPWRVPAATVFLLFTTFSLRAASESAVRHDRATGPLGHLVYFVLLASYLLLSSTVFPAWSSITVLKNMSGSDGRNLSTVSLVKTAGIHLLFAAAGYGISLHRLIRTARVVRAS